MRSSFLSFVTRLFSIAVLAVGIAAFAIPAQPASAALTPIAGGTQLSPTDLATWFKANTKLTYRASVPLDQLAGYFINEGIAEGVRGDIAFAQSIKETGWFNFPDYGQVHPEDNNFAGIGACNSCNGGAKFGNAQLGVRAQIQYLHMYADINVTPSTLAYPMVYHVPPDSVRGKAPNWEDLNGKWAYPGTGYGESIVALYAQMFTYAGVSATCPPDNPPNSSQSSGTGYWSVAADGGVFSFGVAQFYGSTGNRHLNAPVVSIIGTPTNTGYWLFAKDGGIFSFGSAQFYGSTGAMRLAAPIVGMAVTPTNKGYWLVGADGGVFSFGAAQFFGSTGGMRLNQPVVGMAPSPTGNGYWLAAADGGVFAFGDARFAGSMGGIKLNRPVVSVTRPASSGYWLLGQDGGVFSFGGAPYYGSLGGCTNRTATTIQPSPDGLGYYIASNEGRIATFGDAKHFGYMFAANTPAIGLAVLH